MKIELSKKPQGVTIVEGFPGFGLVGTIATEYLLDHLDTERIGSIWFNEMNPVVAVHNQEVVEPLGIFYDKKNKLVIMHALTNVSGVEWKLANAISDVAKKLGAKEVISIEGVGSLGKNIGEGAYFYSKKFCKNWEKAGIKHLDEGIVMGVTASLLIKLKSSPLSCVFAETSTGLPDSRAAARVIEVLDKYLKLNVDYKPLIKKAEGFETKIKTLMKNTKKIKTSKQKKELSYMG